MNREIDLICLLDIEQTQDSFHAHAVPQDVDIFPGDIIIVHDAPDNIAFGEKLSGTRKATLRRAGALAGLWTRVSSSFQVNELYEVGFQPIADAPSPKG